MCEAKPGVRCAGDTCAQADVTREAYAAAHPGGPEVSTLPIDEAMTDKPWDSLGEDPEPVAVSSLGIAPGDSHWVSGHELGDNILDHMEIVQDFEGNYRVEGTVALDIEEQLCEAARIDGDHQARFDWLSKRADAIDGYLMERYGLDGITGEGWGFVEAKFTRDLAPDADTADAYSELYDNTKMVDLHNETDQGTFGSPYVYSQLAQHLAALDEIKGETSGDALRTRLLDAHRRSVMNDTPEGERVALRRQNKAIATRLKELPHTTRRVTRVSDLRVGDVVEVTRDGRVGQYVVQRAEHAELGDPTYRASVSLGAIGGRGYSLTLHTPDLAPDAMTRTVIDCIETSEA